jgi:SAM-dependent methyltransferase
MGYEKSAHLYDLFDRKGNIEFFFHYALPVGEVLDIGAGTGRIAVPLAERGLNVWCVDPSPAMRAEFKKKLKSSPNISDRINIIKGDAASFEMNRVFPMAFLSGCFDHFLDEHERCESLRNIGANLNPGGILLFDVFVGCMGEKPSTPAGEVVMGDQRIRRYVGREALSTDRQLVKIVYEVYQGKECVERIEEQGLVGITTREEVRRILSLCDFKAIREYGGYDFALYKEGGSLLIMEAIKKPDLAKQTGYM